MFIIFVFLTLFGKKIIKRIKILNKWNIIKFVAKGFIFLLFDYLCVVKFLSFPE